MTAVTPARGRLFTAIEAAQYLGISTKKVRAEIARGELVAMRARSGRLEGVYQTDCDRWVAAHRQAPTPVPVRPAVDDLVAHLPGAGRFI